MVVLEVVSKRTSTALLDDVARLEKRRVRLSRVCGRESERVKFSVELTDGVTSRIFPKHESLAETLVKEALKPQNALILALDADAAVSGYVLCRRAGLGVGHIDKLAVAPSRRRQGVGRLLLASALAHLQTSRAASAMLVVDVERTGAIALYEAAGFCAVASRADFYQPGRHALVMQRALS